MLLLCLNTFFACTSSLQHKSVQNIGQCYYTAINHMLMSPSCRVCCMTHFRFTLQWVCPIFILFFLVNVSAGSLLFYIIKTANVLQLQYVGCYIMFVMFKQAIWPWLQMIYTSVYDIYLTSLSSWTRLPCWNTVLAQGNTW